MKLRAGHGKPGSNTATPSKETSPAQSSDTKTTSRLVKRKELRKKEGQNAESKDVQPTSKDVQPMSKDVDAEAGKNKVDITTPPYQGSLGMAVMNLSSRILLTILVAVPYALREAGFGLGVILIIIIGFLTDYTLDLLIKAGDITGEKTYVGVVRKVFGKWGVFGVVFKQFGYPFLLMIASNVLITDILLKLVILIAGESDLSGIEGKFYARREFLISVSTVVITLPLSLYRNIGLLSKWAAMSLVLLLVLMIFVIVRFTELDLPDTPDSYSFAAIDVGRSIGILIAAFMVQHSAFLIFDAMIDPSDDRLFEASYIAVSLAMLGALVFGVVGYATFTDNVEANILNNYCTDDTLMNVGRVLFVISVYLAFPGEVVVARTVIERTVFKNSQPPPLWRHVLLTFLIVVASVGFSFLTDCLSIILELNGVTNAAPLAFVIPPMLMLKLDKGPKCSCKRLPLYFVLILGVGVTVFGLFLSIKSIIDGVECSHGQEPAFCFSVNPFVNHTGNVSFTTAQPMTTI